MLGQRRRPWTNIIAALTRRLVFAGKSLVCMDGDHTPVNSTQNENSGFQGLLRPPPTPLYQQNFDKIFSSYYNILSLLWCTEGLVVAVIGV